MGNCVLGGVGDEEEVGASQVIKVVTSNGGIMEFPGPITVESIVDEFPGHGIFPSHDLFWRPLGHHEWLCGGDSYYLLPLGSSGHSSITSSTWECDGEGEEFGGQSQRIQQVNLQEVVGHVRSKSVPLHQITQSGTTPYRMSFDYCHASSSSSSSSSLNRSPPSDTHCRRHRRRRQVFGGRRHWEGGIWKVKLTISPKQLVEILSKDAPAQEFIKSAATVAKCGNRLAFSSSDHDHYWNTTTTRNTTPDSISTATNNRRIHAASCSSDQVPGGAFLLHF